MSSPSAVQQAATLVCQILHHGRSLTALLAKAPPGNDLATVKALCFGVCRFYPQLTLLLQRLLHKPLATKHTDLQALLLVALFQIRDARQPEYAVVSAAVGVTTAMNKPWAKALVNAVLRNYLRRRETLETALRNQAQFRYAHPTWMIEQTRNLWPHDWQGILHANNQQAPMVLRVNSARCGTAAYLTKLHRHNMHANICAWVNQGLELLQSCEVSKLPGFDQGLVSVQDVAAQLATSLLQVEAKHRVLDCCAAPGGKCCHIAECHVDAQILALDNSSVRLQRLTDNSHRLGLSNINTLCADAARPQTWFDGQLFERILLDVPCSASGVIRRHPDIKLLRRAHDLNELQRQQDLLLRQIWPLLAPGGLLLYCTCSVYAQENEQRIAAFLSGTPDAKEQLLTGPWGRTRSHGRQILPGEENADGFYYARLEKTP